MSVATADFNAVAVDRVNIGCGPRPLAGWCNTDIRLFPGVDKVMDATVPWPFPEASVRYVYGEHFLEHLGMREALDFLLNAGVVLRLGGRLRLSTPNLEWVLATHFRLQCFDEDTRIRETMVINRAFHGWGHHFLWTSEFISHVLRRLGYGGVRFYGYGESDDPGLRGLERHGGYSISDGRPSVLIVEASRGAQPISRDSRLVDQITTEFIRHVESGH
jgi:predicted SAM-dependent methyltransferase